MRFGRISEADGSRIGLIVPVFSTEKSLFSTGFGTEAYLTLCICGFPVLSRFDLTFRRRSVVGSHQMPMLFVYPLGRNDSQLIFSLFDSIFAILTTPPLMCLSG